MKKNKQSIVVVVVITLIVFIWLMLKNNTVFYFDSYGYWGLGNYFWDENGSIAFGNFPQSIRGYVLPFILGICNRLGCVLFNNEYVVYRLLYSFCATLLMTYILPSLFGVKKSGIHYIIGCIVAMVLFVYFWGDLLLFPLSDMIAFFLFTCVLLFLRQLTRKDFTFNYKTILSILFCGILSYCVYNIRTVYFLPLIISYAFFFMCMIVRKDIKAFFKFVVMIGVSLCLMVVVAYPQMLINKRIYNEFSPSVITSAFCGGQSLASSQLVGGSSHVRYETYVGDPEQYPLPYVVYVNEVADNMLEKAKIESVKDFCVYWLKHPFDACGLYMEHIISGITLFYNKVYIPDLRVGKKVFFFNCLVFITAILGLISKKKISFKPHYLLIVFPGILAMPGQVEARFCLPIYLVVYMYIALCIDYREMFSYIKKSKWKPVSLVIFIMLFWLFSANILLSQADSVNMDFSGHIYVDEK